MSSRHAKSRRSVPCLWLMTDERVKEVDLLSAVRRLPVGSGLVLRHHGWSGRRRQALLRHIRAVSRRRRLTILVAGRPAQAARWGADGWHGPTSQSGARPNGAARLLHSASAHNLAELRAAEQAGVDLIFVSPLFATRSHPGARQLGAFRFAAIARRSHIPVMALGGVSPRHAALVRRLGAAGYGAIDGLVKQH